MAVEPGAEVSQKGPEDDLEIGGAGRQEGEAPQQEGFGGWGRRSGPGGRREERQAHGETEERLGEGAVDDRNPALRQEDPQPAQHALENDGEQGHHSEPAEPAPPLGQPERHRQRNREEPDGSAQQAVAVLVEDSADHLRRGVEEHVVAERRGPVRDRQGGARVGDEPADQDQDEGGGAERQRQSVSHPLQWCAAAPAGNGRFWGEKSSDTPGTLYS